MTVKIKKARIRIKSGNKKGKYRFFFDRVIAAEEAASMPSISNNRVYDR